GRVEMGVGLDSVIALAITQHALGDQERAQDTLCEMADLLSDVASAGPLRLLRSVQARLALARGDIDDAGHQLRLIRDDQTVTFPSFIELPEMTRARWLLLQGTQSSLQDVAAIVAAVSRLASLRGQALNVITAHGIEALLLQARGDTEGALTHLQQIMALARGGELLRWFVDFG